MSEIVAAKIEASFDWVRLTVGPILQYRTLTMDAPDGTAVDRGAPISMIAQPARSSAAMPVEHFPGESAEEFEAAVARLKPSARRANLTAGVRRLLGRNRHDGDLQRVVAFDGFRSDLFDEKTERDRRYGTVYSVTEWKNAYMVRLEMPRRLPASSLKEAWGLPDAMPDYTYSLDLQNQVLAIQASVPSEAIRRLAYVSSSFPADFLTRIDFARAVSGFVHRLEEKILEVVVFKSESRPDQKR